MVFVVGVPVPHLGLCLLVGDVGADGGGVGGRGRGGSQGHFDHLQVHRGRRVGKDTIQLHPQVYCVSLCLLSQKHTTLRNMCR